VQKWEGETNNIMIMKKYMYFILIGIPLVIAPFTSDYFYLPKLLVLYFIVTLLIVIHFFSLKKKKFDNDLITKVLIIYLGILVVSTLFSTDPFTSLYGKFRRQEGLFALISYALVFLFSKTYFIEDKQLDRFLNTSMVVVALYGLSQYFGFDPIPRDEIRMGWTTRAFSTIGNPNFLGSYLVLMLPIPILRFLEKGSKYHLLVASFVFSCLIVTFTRSAQLGFLVIFLLVAFSIIRNKLLLKRFIILSTLLVVLTLGFNEHSQGMVLGRFLSIGRDVQTVIDQDEGFEKAGSIRIYIWTRSLALVIDRPLLGYGLEALEMNFVNRYRDEMIEQYGVIYLVDKVHNEYLHIAVSSGILSLIAYLVFISLVVKKGIKMIKINRSYLPYFIAVIAYLVQAFFNISVVSVAYIFWLYLGIISNENVFTNEIDHNT